MSQRCPRLSITCWSLCLPDVSWPLSVAPHAIVRAPHGPSCASWYQENYGGLLWYRQRNSLVANISGHAHTSQVSASVAMPVITQLASRMAAAPLTRPPALRKGDTIAIVAPASGLAAHVPHRLAQAQRVLESHGYHVKVYDSVRRTSQENMAQLVQQLGDTVDREIYDAQFPCYASADAITRSQELMQAFLDPEVHAIVCAIGGYTSHEMLEYLDMDAIRAHPKIFVGYSDITSLHCALQAQAGLVTFYGPSAICQFGEFPAPLEFTMEHFWRVTTRAHAIGCVQPSTEWTDDKTANWLTRADETYVNRMKQNPGYEWLRPGTASGPLLGGCLPVLLNIRGTRFMPDLTDAVLLLETPEGEQFDQGMSLDNINMVLGALRVDGTFDKIKGLVLGRVFAHTDDSVREIKRLVKYHTRGTNFPILYGVDIGHTDPMLTLALGCKVTLDSTRDLFSIDEPGVRSK